MFQSKEKLRGYIDFANPIVPCFHPFFFLISSPIKCILFNLSCVCYMTDRSLCLPLFISSYFYHLIVLSWVHSNLFIITALNHDCSKNLFFIFTMPCVLHGHWRKGHSAGPMPLGWCTTCLTESRLHAVHTPTLRQAILILHNMSVVVWNLYCIHNSYWQVFRGQNLNV